MIKSDVLTRIGIAGLVFAFLLICFGLAEAAKAPVLLRIGTAGSGGTYYYIGAAVSSVVNKHVPEVRMNSIATGGGVENMRRLVQGSLEFGLAAPSNFIDGQKDKTFGPEKVNFVHGVHNTVQHFLVRADRLRGAKTVGEWLKKGVKLAVGEPGSSGHMGSVVMLKVFGMTMDDIDAHKISQAEAAEALKDGNIDAMFMGGSIPLTSMSNAAQSVDTVLLPFTEEDIKKFQQVEEYQFGATVPANTYRGQKKAVYTVGRPSILMVRSNMDQDIVYKIIKAIHDHLNEIVAIHPAGREWEMGSVYRGADFAQRFGYKFHPGMVKYLKEKKTWNSKYEK